MSADGHGIPDSAAQAAHQVIGHADQTQHQEELERRRSGLNDQALDNERTFIKGAERRASHLAEVVCSSRAVQDKGTEGVVLCSDPTAPSPVQATISSEEAWANQFSMAFHPASIADQAVVNVSNMCMHAVFYGDAFGSVLEPARWADEEDGWADKSDAIAEFSVSNLRKPMKPGASPVQSMIQVPRTQPARTRIADQQPRAPRG
ncbi:hypothetical protein G7054_g8208 [Neopestalotiopsis clavispora]|nr:hypothetical protein G7054_g8208 [Neopestalotiopsis clavispora]